MRATDRHRRTEARSPSVPPSNSSAFPVAGITELCQQLRPLLRRDKLQVKAAPLHERLVSLQTFPDKVTFLVPNRTSASPEQPRCPLFSLSPRCRINYRFSVSVCSPLTSCLYWRCEQTPPGSAVVWMSLTKWPSVHLLFTGANSSRSFHTLPPVHVQGDSCHRLL